MQGSRYSSAQNKLEYRMNAFWEHSLTLNREFQLKSFRLNLQAKVTNLTDQQYEIIQYYPMPGRQFTFSGTFYF
jgi:outer membrane cobalamin receptor